MTGSASVIPYGVCGVACGSTSRSACRSDAGTGAPADTTRRTPARAARCAASSSDAVATTVRSAAGEAKIIVASTAATASASAAAVSAPGLRTAGTADGIPSAGP